MDTTSGVWALLSSITVGKLVGWIIVIFTIFAAFGAGIIKLYKVFTKYKELKDKDETRNKDIQELKEITAEITQQLKEQKNVNYKQLRYNIINLCDEANANGYITASKLQILEEDMEDYEEIYNGNGFVKSQVIKVRQLPVRGGLYE